MVTLSVGIPLLIVIAHVISNTDNTYYIHCQVTFAMGVSTFVDKRSLWYE